MTKKKSKAVTKSTKKTAKKKGKAVKNKLFDLSTVVEDKILKDFKLSVVSESTQSRIPYTINFTHKGLQKITGGLIGGTMMEIGGDSQSFKSHLLYDLMVNCVNMGGACFLNDIENAFQAGYLKKSGLKEGGAIALDRLNDIDKFFAAARKFIKAVRKKKKKIPILIGVDSFAAFKTAEALDIEDQENSKKKEGYGAMRKNSKFSQKLDSFIKFIGDNDATFVLINQARRDHKILYGDNRYTLAENVIGFWATQRLMGKAIGNIKKEVKSVKNKSKKKKKTTGLVASWEAIKNRFYVPKSECEAKVLFRTGLLTYSGLDELLVNEGWISPGTKSIEVDGKKKTIKGFRDDENNFYKNVKEFIKVKPESLAPVRIEDLPSSDEMAEDETVEE